MQLLIFKGERISMANKKETKHERFVRVAAKRTQDVLDSLKALEKCCHPAVYEYTEKELKKIYAAIEHKLQEVKDTFAGSKRFSLAEGSN